MLESGRKVDVKSEEAVLPDLKDAIRQARVENAERTAVIVDLRDAEAARLELLNDALDPLFAQIPKDVDLFDRGLSRGDVPRLWLDSLAHVHMAREKRIYRFVQDTRYGRAVLAESFTIADIVEAATKYVARRMIERERALASDTHVRPPELPREAIKPRRRRGMRAVKAFIFGLIAGVVALFAAAFLMVPPH